MKTAYSLTWWRTATFVAVGLIAASMGQARARELYVDTKGSDANPGTARRPLATLHKARDLLRAGKAGAAVVHVRAGTYLLTESFTLSEKDSGRPGGRIIYRADGAVRLLGGRVVPAKAFRPVSDPAVKARLPEAAREHVVELDLRALGITHTGPFPDLFRDGGGIMELYVNGQRLPLARWPNKDYTTMKRVVDSGVWSGKDTRGGSFEYRDKRPSQWQKAVSDGLWLKGFWRVPWEPETVRIASIDATKGTITQAREVGGGLGSKYSKMVKGTRVGSGKENWYALNLLEELDRPGEWCLRFPTKKLYLWPPADLAKSSVLIADMKEPLIAFDKVSHVTVRGFTLEGGLGEGVTIDGGSNVAIGGCEIRNLGGTGIVINEGTEHHVVSCDIHHLGKGGIYVYAGDRLSLTPAKHQILNNHIYRTGEVKTTYAPAIDMSFSRFHRSTKGVGNRVAHNLIHDLPHAAILYGGNDHLFEYNEIWRIALDSHDVGALYTVRDWTSRGNVIRYNLVADSPNCNAFYMDDGDSGDRVTGNVAWRTSCGPFIGGGRDNIVTGNLIIDAKVAGLHIDDRGMSRGYNKDNKSYTGKLDAVKHKDPPWSTRYPKLATILSDNPPYPSGNLLRSNVLIDSTIRTKVSKELLTYSTISNNPIKSREDVGLPAKGNPIPALRELKTITFPDVSGFEPIPIGKIGLYKDQFRKSLPDIATP